MTQRQPRSFDALNHEPTRLACKAERAFLKGLGGGCLVPIAANAKIEAGVLTLKGLVASPDGSEADARRKKAGPSKMQNRSGTRLAEKMLASGASRILS